MIRCVWVLTDLRGGGAEKLPLVLGPSFTRTSLTVLLLKRAIDHAAPAGIEVVALGDPQTRLALAAPALVKRGLSLCRNADVIVGGMEGAPIVFAAVWGQLVRRPVVGVLHPDLFTLYARHAARGSTPDASARLSPLMWAALGLGYRACRAAVAVSEDGRRSLERLGVPRERTSVIPNPVASRLPHAGLAPVTARATRILTIARLHPAKGIDLLLEAAKQLGDCAWEWTVLGDGPERESLAARARELGVADRVRFAGFHPDPAPFLDAADLFVLPSRAEGLPLALLEAMAAGLAVVATRCGSGVVDALDGGAAGVLVPPGDPAALAAAVRTLVADPERRVTLAAAARARAAAFEPTAIASRWEALFDAVRPRRP